MNRNTHNQQMARVFMREARSRHGNPAQRDYVSTLVRWARDRHHRYLRERRSGQLRMAI